MALTDSDLTELLAALKAGEMTDTIRTSLGLLQKLSRDQREAIAFRFGLDTGHGRSIEQTATELGHSIRQTRGLLETAIDARANTPSVRPATASPDRQPAAMRR